MIQKTNYYTCILAIHINYIVSNNVTFLFGTQIKMGLYIDTFMNIKYRSWLFLYSP